MLSVRQSSLCGYDDGSRNPGWTQIGPYSNASNTLVHDVTGSGGFLLQKENIKYCEWS